MDFLVLTPPICTPSEPAAGAYMLTAGLKGHGFDAALLDLSLEFFYSVLKDPSLKGPSPIPALDYLKDSEGGYDPAKHRGVTGVLHKKLAGFDQCYPGWKLTLMDLAFPGGVLDPVAIKEYLKGENNPFKKFWPSVLDPVIERERPKAVLLSLAYLSQLPAAIDLVSFLGERGIEPLVGGSLPRSLQATGHGIESLERVFPKIVTSDGSSLFTGVKSEHLLDRLSPPTLLSSKRYISSKPIVPLALSSGCFWRKCLFCPDRNQEYRSIPMDAIDGFLSDMSKAKLEGRPMVHLLDSAIPPGRLRAFLPLAKQYGLDFYGFARPTAELTRDHLLEDAASAGLAMLQLGVESGSPSLLSRFNKGIDPEEAKKVLNIASDAGIRTYLYLLFGLPGETDSDRQATLDFVTENADSVDFLNLSIFNLPRYSELTDRAEEFDIEIGDFPEDSAIRLYWPFTCSGSSPREEARGFLRDIFNKHPDVHRMVLRTPRWLRAAHLALMKRTAN